MSLNMSKCCEVSMGNIVFTDPNEAIIERFYNLKINFHCRIDGWEADFKIIDECLCAWVREHWDYKRLIWEKGKFVIAVIVLDNGSLNNVVIVPFNPTLENMAEYLTTVVGPQQLANKGVELRKVVIENLRCYGSYELRGKSLKCI